VGHMRIRLRSRLADIGGFGHPRWACTVPQWAPPCAPVRMSGAVLFVTPRRAFLSAGRRGAKGGLAATSAGAQPTLTLTVCGVLSIAVPTKTVWSPAGTTKSFVQWSHTERGWFVAAGSQVMVTRRDAAGSRNTLVKPHEPLRRLLPARDAQVHLRDLRTGDGPGVGHREGHLNGPGPVVHRARQTHLGQLEGGVRQAEPDRTASTIAAIAERSPPRSSSAPSSMSPATPASASIHACRGTADGVC
jgi:hypothetical protein